MAGEVIRLGVCFLYRDVYTAADRRSMAGIRANDLGGIDMQRADQERAAGNAILQIVDKSYSGFSSKRSPALQDVN